MTKCEVEFDGDCIYVDDFKLKVFGDCGVEIGVEIHSSGFGYIETKETIEQAIKYCLEN